MIKDSTTLKKNLICLLIVPGIVFANSEDNSEEEYDFDWNSVSQEMGVKIDAQSYEVLHRTAVIGLHTYDVFINGKFLCREKVEISTKKNSSSYVVAVPAKVLQRLPLKDDYLNKILKIEQNEKISSLDSILPGAKFELNEDALTLNVNIPQTYQKERREEIVNDRFWDYGIPALRVNYDLDFSRTDDREVTNERGFFSYDTQANLGVWRLFARGSVRKATGESTDAEIWDRHVSRAIPFLHAKVKVGEFSTTNRYLPSIPIIGVNLFEDADQIEDYDRVYLPVVSGFAPSQALVTIRQDGRVLREVEVSPGPFEFTDLLEVTSGGNIEMEIKEKNGKTSTYIIPYSGNNQKLLKKGRFSWSGAVGKYDGSSDSEDPWVGQIAVGYGFDNGLTLYGGTIYSEDFSRSLIGSAYDAGRWGGFSVQLEHSHTDLNGNRDGNVFEFEWDKYFEDTSSSLGLKYRRTFDGDISSISSVIYSKNDAWGTTSLEDEDYVRDEVSFTISQTIARSVTLSGSAYYTQTKLGKENRSLSASLGFPIGRFYGSLMAQGSHFDTDTGSDKDWLVSFNISIPLNSIFNDSRIPFSSLSMTHTRSEGGDWGNQVNFSSTIGCYSDWNVFFGAQNSSDDDTYNMGVSYDGQYTNASLSASRYHHVNSYGVSLSGGVFGTQYGITFSDNVYDGSVALVHTPDVDGVRLQSAALDNTRGEWQISNILRDYRKNLLSIDPNSLPANVHMISGLQQEVVPADGAVIPVLFETYIGNQVVFTVKDENGNNLPYCSYALVAGMPVSIAPSLVDELGQVYFSAVPDEGCLEVKWSEEDSINTCQAKYSIKSMEKTNGIYIDTLTCRK